jgi:hypothetical protein
VVRFWPARRQARRWEARNRSCRSTTARRTARCALQRNDVPGSEVSLSKLLKHGLVELCLSE